MDEILKVIVKIYGETHEIEVKPDETVLEAALRQDVDLPYSCMSGSCNACQCKIEQGEVTMDIHDALSQEEVASGEVLSCQAHPQTANLTLCFENE